MDKEFLTVAIVFLGISLFLIFLAINIENNRRTECETKCAPMESKVIGDFGCICIDKEGNMKFPVKHE